VTVPRCRVWRAARRPPLQGEAAEEPWDRAEVVVVSHFHPAGSDHRPRTEARVLFDEEALYVQFQVQDRYVRAVARGFQGPVCEDSCVELFVQPLPGRGYFNFEMNCGGTLLLYYIEDPRRTAEGFARYRPVEERHLAGMGVYHSLPRRVEPEIATPVQWTVQYSVPLRLFEPYLGQSVHPAGSTWRGNFYKCADKTSHPHWGAWSPIGEELNFHQPERFGELVFEG
jgi:hypothetical protein